MTDSATIKLEGDNAALKKSLAESRAMLEAFGKMYDEKMRGRGGRGGGGGAVGGGFTAGLGDFAKTALATFTGMGALQTFSGALAKLKSVLQESIKVASDFEVSLIKFDVLFRNAGEGVGFFSSELENMQERIDSTTGYSKGAVRDSMSVFLKYGQIQGEVFEKGLENAADLAAFMGVDMVRGAEMLGRALQNPAQGMLLLSRAGVRLTKEEKTRIKNLQDSMQIQKAQVALNEIITAKFGGLAERMKNETFAGAWEDVTTELSASFKEIGQALLPGLKALIPSLVIAIKEIAKIGAELTPVANALLWAAGLFAEGAHSLRDIGGQRNREAGDDPELYGREWVRRDNAARKAAQKGAIPESENYIDMFGLSRKRPKRTMTEKERQAAMDDAARAEGFVPKTGKPEEQPSGKSLEGTFEDLEATWRRISGASAENSTTEAIDEQTAMLDTSNKEMLVETRTTNVLLEELVYYMTGMPKPGDMAS